MELVDTVVLEAITERCESSSLSGSTNNFYGKHRYIIINESTVNNRDLDELIIDACKNNLTMSLAAKSVGIPYSTFKRKAIKLSVWSPNQGAAGTNKYIKSIEDVFSGKTSMRSYNLKNRLISEGYKESICESCGIGEEWNDNYLVLELDHIDGNNKNNSLENLRILCPNCHSQTPTFRGRKY